MSSSNKNAAVAAAVVAAVASSGAKPAAKPSVVKRALSYVKKNPGKVALGTLGVASTICHAHDHLKKS